MKRRMDGRSGKKKDPSKGGRPTEAEVAQRKIRILKIATQLFIRHGYSTTTLDEISRSSGVAKKTLYATYGDKGEIFGAVIRHRVAGFGIANLRPTLDRRSAKRTLKAMAKSLLELYDSEESTDLRRLIIAESQRFPDLMRSILRTTTGKVYGIIGQLLEEMRTKNLLRMSNAGRAAKLFMDLIVGTSYLHTTAGLRETVPSPSELDEKIDMFIKYYS